MKNVVEDVDGFITSFGGLSVFSESMASFRDTCISNLLVESFNDDDISEHEFLLFYDANTSKTPDFPYDCYGSFDLNEIDDSECLAEFRFHKNNVPVPSFRGLAAPSVLHVPSRNFL